MGEVRLCFIVDVGQGTGIVKSKAFCQVSTKIALATSNTNFTRGSWLSLSHPSATSENLYSLHRRTKGHVNATSRYRSDQVGK